MGGKLEKKVTSTETPENGAIENTDELQAKRQDLQDESAFLLAGNTETASRETENLEHYDEYEDLIDKYGTNPSLEKVLSLREKVPGIEDNNIYKLIVRLMAEYGDVFQLDVKESFNEQLNKSGKSSLSTEEIDYLVSADRTLAPDFMADLSASKESNSVKYISKLLFNTTDVSSPIELAAKLEGSSGGAAAESQLGNNPDEAAAPLFTKSSDRLDFLNAPDDSVLFFSVLPTSIKDLKSDKNTYTAIIKNGKIEYYGPSINPENTEDKEIKARSINLNDIKKINLIFQTGFLRNE